MNDFIRRIVEEARKPLSDDALAVLNAEREWDSFTRPALDLYQSSPEVHRSFAKEMVAMRLQTRFGLDAEFWGGYLDFALANPPGSDITAHIPAEVVAPESSEPLPVVDDSPTVPESSEPVAVTAETTTVPPLRASREQDIIDFFKPLADGILLVRDAIESRNPESRFTWSMLSQMLQMRGAPLEPRYISAVVSGKAISYVGPTRQVFPMISPKRVPGLLKALDAIFDEVTATPEPQPEVAVAPKTVGGEVGATSSSPAEENGNTRIVPSSIPLPSEEPKPSRQEVPGSKKERLSALLDYLREKPQKQARHHEIARDLFGGQQGVASKTLIHGMRRGSVELRGQDVYHLTE